MFFYSVQKTGVLNLVFNSLLSCNSFYGHSLNLTPEYLWPTSSRVPSLLSSVSPEATLSTYFQPQNPEYTTCARHCLRALQTLIRWLSGGSNPRTSHSGVRCSNPSATRRSSSSRMIYYICNFSEWANVILQLIKNINLWHIQFYIYDVFMKS